MKEFDDANRKKIEKNFKTRKLLVCGISPNEYNMISACEIAKDIWDCLQMAHEGTSQAKELKVDLLTTQYEAFILKHCETIQEIHSRFTVIINKLNCVG